MGGANSCSPRIGLVRIRLGTNQKESETQQVQSQTAKKKTTLRDNQIIVNSFPAKSRHAEKQEEKSIARDETAHPSENLHPGVVNSCITSAQHVLSSSLAHWWMDWYQLTTPCDRWDRLRGKPVIWKLYEQHRHGWRWPIFQWRGTVCHCYCPPTRSASESTGWSHEFLGPTPPSTRRMWAVYPVVRRAVLWFAQKKNAVLWNATSKPPALMLSVNAKHAAIHFSQLSGPYQRD